jgi:methionine-rich copper-binding protein CopC
MRLRLRAVLGTAILSLVGLGPAQAAPSFDIDTFTTTQGPLTAPANSVVSTVGSDIWGQERDLRVTRISGANPVTAQVTAGGDLVFTVGAATAGDVEVVWDGADADATRVKTSGLPTDLTSSLANAFKVTVVSTSAAGATLLMEVFTDGSHSSVRAFPLPLVASGSPKTFYLSYAGFVPNRTVTGPNPGADFTSVRAIRMFLRGTNVTVTLDAVQRATATPTVAAQKTESHGPAVAGDTLSYTMTIKGSGGDATAVALSDTIDANTTLTGAARVSPIAVNDAYPNAGVPTVASPLSIVDPNLGVLKNDRDVLSQALHVISTAPMATDRGGSVTVNADGTFTYDASGVPGGLGGIPDTFTYKMDNDQLPVDATFDDTAIVTITLSDDAPTVTSTVPISNTAVDQAADTNVTINFSEPVSVTVNAFKLECPVGTPVPFVNTTGLGPASSFVLNPTGDLPYGTICTGTVVADQVSDQDSIDPPDGLDVDYTFTFPVDAAPTVTSTVPISNTAVVQAADTNITINFSESVNVTASAFTVECPVATPVTFVNTTGTGPASSFVLNPTGDLPYGVTCTVKVIASQVSDQDAIDPPDHMTADYTFTFPIDAAPSVTTTVPTNAATNIAPATTITVNFSESVAATTSSFTINCGAANLGYTLSASPASTFTLTPSASLPFDRTCTVTVIAAQISDTDTVDPPDHMVADYVFSFGVRPNAVNDSYSAIGNVFVDSSTGAPFAVTGNDNFVLTPTISAFDSASANGGVVTVVTSGVAIGRFTYNPPVGFTGTDTFNYTLSTANGSSTATVTFTVGGMIWFVNNNSGACSVSCNGRETNPFTSLANFVTANDGVGLHPSNNQNIFLYESASAYGGPITLRTGQKLIGQDATTTLSAIVGQALPPGSSLPAMNTGAPATTIDNTVTMANSTTVRGLTISSTGNTGLTAAGLSGANTGLITADLIVTTTTGTAVSIAGATSGTSSMAFKSISAGTVGGGPANGVILNGYAGGFTVVGDGSNSANGSGGTIQKTTSNGISLNSVTGTGVSFSSMNIANGTHNGINGTVVNNFALVGASVTGNGTVANDHGVNLVDTTGNATLTNDTVSGSFDHNVVFDSSINSTAVLNSLTITNGTYSGPCSSFPCPASGGDGLLVQTKHAAVIKTGSITGATFLNNTSWGIDLVQNADATFTSTIGDGVGTPASGTFTISGCTFTHNTLGISFASGGGNGVGHMLARFVNNTLTNTRSFAINVVSGATSVSGSTQKVLLDNNHVGTAGIPDSGSKIGEAIQVTQQGETVGTVTITNNLIRALDNGAGEFGSRGIDVQTLGPSATGKGPTAFDVNLTGNDVDAQYTGTFPQAAIYLGVDDQGSPTTMHAEIHGNTVPAIAGCESSCTPSTGMIFYDEVTPPSTGTLFNFGGNSNVSTEIANTNTGTAGKTCATDLVRLTLTSTPVNTVP